MTWKGKDEAKKGKSCGICWKGHGNDYLGFLEGLLIDFPTPWDHNIPAARYCDVRAELRRAIQNKRRGYLTITLVHTLIVPSDYHLFPQLATSWWKMLCKQGQFEGKS